MSDEPKMIDLAEHFAKVKSFHVEGPGIEPHVIWATQMEDPQAEMIPIEATPEPITRYDFVWDYDPSRSDFTEEDPEGEYVKFDDHLAELKRQTDAAWDAAIMAAYALTKDKGMMTDDRDEILDLLRNPPA